MIKSVKIKKTVLFFFVALFVGYYANVTLFFHSHIINGVTIVHSHIHKNSHHDTKSGGHSEQSITLIAQISQLEYVNSAGCDIPCPVQRCLHESQFTETAHKITPLHLQHPSLRAPPVGVI